jgi:diguanylate cyclase (GGDEF)-like protein
MANQDEARSTPIRVPVALARDSHDEPPVIVVLRGPRCAHTFRPRPMAVIGREDDVDLSLGDPAVSRRHATLVDDDGRWSIEDLGSKNGTRVNGEHIRGRRELQQGDRIAVGANTELVFTRPHAAGEYIDRAMMERARRDRLTGALNRRYFEEELVREFSYARRHGEPLSLLLLDLDRFKRVNDEHGYPAGDAALTMVSAIVHSSVQGSDVVARGGGDEFAILCRGAPPHRALQLAGRLRGLIAADHVRVRPDARIGLTASIGVATYPKDPTPTAFELLAAADRALDLAKARGGDRVATPDETAS